MRAAEEKLPETELKYEFLIHIISFFIFIELYIFLCSFPFLSLPFYLFSSHPPHSQFTQETCNGTFTQQSTSQADILKFTVKWMDLENTYWVR